MTPHERYLHYCSEILPQNQIIILGLAEGLGAGSRQKGKGDEIKLDVYLGFRAGKVSISPGYRCPSLAPGEGTAQVALCALQPHPLLPQLHKAAFPLAGGPWRRDSFWECLTGVESPLLPCWNQNLFCRNHLRPETISTATEMKCLWLILKNTFH